MTDQDKINRAIAEALTAQGFERRLLWVWWHDEGQFEGEPKDFTDPRYLLAALEAYCDKTGYGYILHRYYDPTDGIDADIYGAGAHQFLDGHNTCWRGNSPHGKPFDALRNAFAAALGAAAE